MRPARSFLTGAVLATCLLAPITVSRGNTPAGPPPPADDWTRTNFVTAHSASITAEGDPFDPSLHGAMTPSGAACSEALNAAIYRQDILHAFESKAHFDNCAFGASAAYVRDLVDGAGAELARLAASADGAGVSGEVEAAMLKLGQALHAVQDLYAHSNYVELMQAQSPAIRNQGAFPIVEVWTEAGRAQVAELAANGLVSGRVWWSLPHTCRADSPTHGDLAKDSPNSSAGGAPSKFTHRLTGKSVSNHTVAFNLAARATRELLRWAGQRWPVLEKHCGKTLRYIVQPDRRAANCRVEGDASSCRRD